MFQANLTPVVVQIFFLFTSYHTSILRLAKQVRGNVKINLCAILFILLSQLLKSDLIKWLEVGQTEVEVHNHDFREKVFLEGFTILMFRT